VPYVIVAKDKPDSLELRQQVRAEHLEYLTRHQARLLAGGAMIEDDGSGGFGSVIIYDPDDRAEAERFAADDPFAKAGLFESVQVARWRKVFLDGKRLV
jgi:uncharacterized protein YciI